MSLATQQSLLPMNMAQSSRGIVDIACIDKKLKKTEKIVIFIILVPPNDGTFFFNEP